MGEIFLNYLILIVGIGLIGCFWALTTTTQTIKGVIKLVLLFVVWSVISYTIQLVTGLSV